MAYTKFKKQPVKKEPRMIRNWSFYQSTIFDDVETGEGNTHVSALAGSGKTSTLVESLYHVPFGLKILYCAFAKAIQEELDRRSPVGTDCFTFHSIGYKACRQAFPWLGKVDSAGDKLNGYIKAERGDEPETQDVRSNLYEAVNLAKGYLASTPEEIDAIIDRHGIEICSDTREQFVTSVLKIMDGCKKDNRRIDFADMIWFPYVYGLPVQTYDRVFIDEAQDLNLAQIDLALRSVSKDGRIVSCGDKNQAIYGFAGADSNSIQNIIDRMHSKTFPLNVTYRCSKAVVDLAKGFVPEFEAAPDAIDGSVQTIGINAMEESAKPGDFIISRTNAPLIRHCLNLLKAGIPANIKGRDLGKSFFYWIKLSKAQSVPGLMGWLQEFKAAEVERLTALRRDVTLMQDKVECLESICEGCRDIRQVKNRIEELFVDGDDIKDRVILGTTHKLKGLERKNVFLLNGTFKPGKNQEETNLYYVGITRAKENLFLVNKAA